MSTYWSVALPIKMMSCYVLLCTWDARTTCPPFHTFLMAPLRNLVLKTGFPLGFNGAHRSEISCWQTGCLHVHLLERCFAPLKNHTWVWTERCSNVSQLVGSFVWWNMMKLHMKSRWNRYDVMVMKMLFRILGLLYGDGQFFVLWCHGDETAMKSWWTTFSDIHQDSLTYGSVLISTAQKMKKVCKDVL